MIRFENYQPRIVDRSKAKRNILYEAGYAHALNKLPDPYLFNVER